MSENDQSPTPGTEEEPLEFPKAWMFDEDGAEVRGTFLRFEEGQTSNGPTPIVVLDVDGEERSIWLFHTAVRSKFGDRVAAGRDFEVGERVGIRQTGMKPTKNGRGQYMSYVVHFPDAPQLDAKAIFGVEAKAGEEATEVPYESVDVAEESW